MTSDLCSFLLNLIQQICIEQNTRQVYQIIDTEESKDISTDFEGIGDN